MTINRGLWLCAAATAMAFCGCKASGSGEAQITGLQSEYLTAPIGIDNGRPRLSWRMDDSRQGARQTSYRVVVGNDSAAVAAARGEGLLWDTGEVESDDMAVTYAGEPLKPFTKYYWRVTGGDKNRRGATSEVASFETGMMGMEQWQGTWISDGHDAAHRPAPYFRKRFSAHKTIRSARAYIAAAGLYELYINGQRVGDQRLNPMYTRFDLRNLYVTHDVTHLLEQGENAVGVLMGNGWYNHQVVATWRFDQAAWRDRPAFCLNLRITYTDGSVETIATDTSWKTSGGALLSNNIYTGEHYDFRQEQKDWNTAAYDDSSWRDATPRQAPSQNITAQQLQPIRHTLEVAAQRIERIDDRTYLFDFGRNMSGVTRVALNGEAGTEVRVAHGERLNKEGRLDLSNIDVYYFDDKEKDPFQTDILLLSGGRDEYTAQFGYKGFRYVEVTASKPISLSQSSITALFTHSDVPAAGSIDTGSPLVNRIWQATNNAYLSNFMGYPTDCPQREKNGWTGDAHFAIETALYNFDGITVYEKWLADHRDAQRPNGVLPDIIPTWGWGYIDTQNLLDWTSTIAIIPWNLYLFYGDSKPLADCYDNIKRYVDFVHDNHPDHLTAWGRGDWVPVSAESDKELSSSIYYYVDTRILAQAAKLFGRQDDHNRYAALAEDIRQAINAKFLNREAGIYAGGSQTELSMPLQWGVTPEDMVEKVVANLAKKVEEAGFHLDVGVLGAKAILNALSENGHAETAYRVAAQDTYPSWGWWIANGATTLLENWDLEATRDISDNHMMFGEVGGWLFKGLGGIFPDPEAPGFKHIVLRPHFIRELGHCTATHRSPYGEIRSAWVWNGDEVTYTVTIPANSTATLTLPDGVKGAGDQRQLEAGTHRFRLKPLAAAR